MSNHQQNNGSQRINKGSSRTMRIRSFPTTINQDYINSLWEMLQRSITEIQHKNNSGLSFEELYRNAYTMVLHKHADKLYNGLRDLIIDHLRTEIRTTILDSINGRFLEVINKMWVDHTTAMVMIRDILMYLDRVYVSSQPGIPSVYDLGLELFRDEITSEQTINEHLKAIVLNMIALERQKEAIEWLDLRNVCQMFITLGLKNNRQYYETEFEILLLEETRDFYRRASQKFLEDNSADVYINSVNDCYQEETERCQRIFDNITLTRIIEVLNDELVSKNMQTIVEMENSGLTFMLANEKIESMKMMYELFRRVDGGTKIMIDNMSKYLLEKGKAIIDDAFGTAVQASDDQPGTSEAAGNNQPKPLLFVQNLIDLKDQFDRYLSKSFYADRDFEQKIHTDFSTFMNLSTKSAEFLSRFIDDKLRKGSKSQTDTEIEEALEKTLILFRFLQDKDLFEGFYKQHLAKRLLLDKNVSDDAEKLMISKLKTECGTQFTAKLEGMFRDMELSNQIMTEYRDRFESNRPDIEISVRVLNQIHWPLSATPPPCLMPPVIENTFQHFRNFYTSKYNGRKIQLNPALGFADVKATFYRVEKKGAPTNAGAEELGSQQETDPPAMPKSGRRREETKILIVNTYQMIILLCFNHQEKISFEQLINETSIQEKDMSKALLALSTGKQQILNRKGNGVEIGKGDEFSVNDQFTSKLTRIKIAQISTGRPEPENKDVRTKVEDDRKHEIEAAIVRVLKARKKILHNELITEVTNQLKHRFMPDPTLIKKRIESLIEREYIDRDKYNQKQYNYIA